MKIDSDLKVVIVIPSRYQSSRLPGKPLIDICGQSMISRTYNQCTLALEGDNVYVATDDDRIYSHCLESGMNVLMTSSSCKTGTDRVYEAACKIEADIYINVQGDEPIINPKDIELVISESRKNPSKIIGAMCPIQQEDFMNPTIPKVVTSLDGSLMYASRIGIPSTKELQFVSARKQVCIYAFSKQSLKDFASSKTKTPLEDIEDIEILRFLEMGYSVQMVEVSNTSLAVDVLEDVDKVRRRIGG